MNFPGETSLAKLLVHPSWLDMALQSRFKVVEESNTLVKLTDVTAPLDRPVNVKIANTRIPDIYATLAKGSIPPLLRASSVTGQAIFVEMNLVASTTAGLAVPCQARLELKLPNHGELTDQFCRDVVVQLLGHIQTPTSETRITDMMRGILSLAD